MSGFNLMVFTALQRFLDGDHGFILNGPPFFVLFICATFAQARMYQPATTYVHDQAFLVAIFSSLLLWPHMEECEWHSLVETKYEAY